MSFRLDFNGSDVKFLNFLAGYSSRLSASLENRMSQLMDKLRQKIVGEKLAGEYLNRRSGRLADSFGPPAIDRSGDSVITGDIQGAGGDASYGQIYERGGTSAYLIRPVNKKALMFMIAGKEQFAHLILHPPAKQRAFLTSAIDDMEEEFREGIRECVMGDFTNG